MGRKDGLVLPEDGFAGGEGAGHVQQALVGAAPETQGNIILRLDEGPVHQHVQQGQQGIGGLAPAAGGLLAQQLLEGVARVAPDRFAGVQRLEVADEGQQLPLVGRLHRLAPQQGQPRDVVGLAGGEDLVAHLFGERGAVAEVPGHFVETAGAPVGASRHKQAGAHAGTVGDVAIFDVGVIHGLLLAAADRPHSNKGGKYRAVVCYGIA